MLSKEAKSGASTKKSPRKKSRSATLQIEFSSSAPEEPAISPKAVRQLEAGFLKFLKSGQIVAPAKCSTAFCKSVTDGLEAIAHKFGLTDMKCKATSCNWYLVDKKWQRLCTYDCSSSKLTASGRAGLE